jgi:hypothetical protein
LRASRGTTSLSLFRSVAIVDQPFKVNFISQMSPKCAKYPAKLELDPRDWRMYFIHRFAYSSFLVIFISKYGYMSIGTTSVWVLWYFLELPFRINSYFPGATHRHHVFVVLSSRRCNYDNDLGLSFFAFKGSSRARMQVGRPDTVSSKEESKRKRFKKR